MKQLLVILILCTFASGNNSPKNSSAAVQSNSQKETQQTSKKTNATTEAKDDILIYPQGFYPGLVPPYVGKDDVEKNMLKHVELYYSYLIGGQYNKAISYLFPDVFKYLHDQVPEYSEAQIKTKMVKMLSRSLNSMEEKIYEAYPQFNRFGQVVKGINRRVESENAIFLVIDIVLQFQGEKDAMYAEDPNIAISLDGGNKWYFVTLSEDTKQILSYRFNETTVSKILGY